VKLRAPRISHGAAASAIRAIATSSCDSDEQAARFEVAAG
jgi:hypothetical protein